ncbi:MAG: hypothetical protein ACRDOJ_07295 [Nocardioidaceae bacterium]
MTLRGREIARAASSVPLALISSREVLQGLRKITDLDAWRVRHPARRKHSRPGGDQQQSSAPK